MFNKNIYNIGVIQFLTIKISGKEQKILLRVNYIRKKTKK